MNLWTQREKESVGQIETVALMLAFTILCIKQMTENLMYVQHSERSSVLCDDLNGKEILKRGSVCL